MSGDMVVGLCSEHGYCGCESGLWQAMLRCCLHCQLPHCVSDGFSLRQQVTEARRGEVLRLRDIGWSVPAIAQQVHATERTIHRDLVVAGMNAPRGRSKT